MKIKFPKISKNPPKSEKSQKIKIKSENSDKTRKNLKMKSVKSVKFVKKSMSPIPAKTLAIEDTGLGTSGMGITGITENYYISG